MSKLFLILTILYSFNIASAFDVISGCEETDYEDASAVASVTTKGLNYVAKCLRVSVGSTVTIAASGTHPLAPLADGRADNPITETSSTKTFSFDKKGTYGYFCERHGDDTGKGMAGAILVVD